MHIGLIDVDGHNFPNLAMMKISAWHKQKGDAVEWYSPFAEHYDLVYMSKVFTHTQDYGYCITNADNVIKGGTGYAIHGAGGCEYVKGDDMSLPYEVEHIMPDYSLYGIKDKAYGFLTRGCPRGCDFCIVGKKEGFKSIKVADITEFWNGQKEIVLLDPNILACRDWSDLLVQLADTKTLVDFTQGLDARMLTGEKCDALGRIRMDEVHFAWDRYEDKDKVLPKLRMFADSNPTIVRRHKAIVYVLVNHSSTLDQDLDRIYTLRDMGYWAYVMIYDKTNCAPVYNRLQNWCNNRFVFGRCPRFEDYTTQPRYEDARQTYLFN
jgi:hypothetical protein